MFISGCTNIQNGQNNVSNVPQGTGITDITPHNDAQRVSLREAINALNSTEITVTNSSEAFDIRYILGKSLDANGTARVWAIGLQKGSSAFFFMYSTNGSQILKWNDGLPESSINPNKIIQPGELFLQNQALIQNITSGGKTDIEEIEVKGDIYAITIRSESGPKEYNFDASTGKAILTQ